MRTRLLSLALVAAATFFGAASTAGAIPGSSYQWQQPGCAAVNACCTQPQLSLGSHVTGLAYTSSSSYAWTQPGAAPVVAPDSQPW
jgi:hypothetical protein